MVLQLLLHLAKFFFGPLQTLLQSGYFRSMRGDSRRRRLFLKEEIYVIESPVGGNLIPYPVPSFTGQCIRGYYLYYDKSSKNS